MWDDDKLWLPHILNNEKIEANFIFKEGDKIEKYDIKVIEKIDRAVFDA